MLFLLSRKHTPFALSLSKGHKSRQGFDRLSPNGWGQKQILFRLSREHTPFALSLSKGLRAKQAFDKLSPYG